jgi:hypothetical protein
MKKNVYRSIAIKSLENTKCSSIPGLSNGQPFKAKKAFTSIGIYIRESKP